MAGLDDLYREVVLDHYRNPRNRGELPSPPAHRVEGVNPLCGDEIVLYADVDTKTGGGTVTNVKLIAKGCSISMSSASMMSGAVKGKSIAQVRALVVAFRELMLVHERKLDGDNGNGSLQPGSLQPGGSVSGGGGSGGDGDGNPQPGARLGDLEALQGVVSYPARIKCALLAWNALTQALDEAMADEVRP